MGDIAAPILTAPPRLAELFDNLVPQLLRDERHPLVGEAGGSGAGAVQPHALTTSATVNPCHSCTSVMA